MHKIITTLIVFSSLLFTANAEVKNGEMAPNFEATNVINSKKLSLNSYKGKIVVLEWHNPNCPFVVKHYKSNNMQTIQKKYTKKGVVWLTVNSGAKGKSGVYSEEEIKNYLNENNFSGSAYIQDLSGEIGKKYVAKTTPHMFVIDKNGKVAYQGAIDSNDSARPETIKDAKNYVASAVDSLIENERIEDAQTEPYGCSVKY